MEIFGNRLAYAPKYRLNVFNKYTFNDNFMGEYGRGLSVGLGARYASEIIISNDQNFNAARGGITAGNYVVWQGMVPTAGPANPCGAGDATYPVDALRRTASSTVCVALLRDAASAPVVPRIVMESGLVRNMKVMRVG